MLQQPLSHADWTWHSKVVSRSLLLRCVVFLGQELGSAGLCSSRSSPAPSGRFLLRSPAGSRQLSDLDHPTRPAP